MKGKKHKNIYKLNTWQSNSYYLLKVIENGVSYSLYSNVDTTFFIVETIEMVQTMQMALNR